MNPNAAPWLPNPHFSHHSPNVFVHGTPVASAPIVAFPNPYLHDPNSSMVPQPVAMGNASPYPAAYGAVNPAPVHSFFMHQHSITAAGTAFTAVDNDVPRNRVLENCSSATYMYSQYGQGPKTTLPHPPRQAQSPHPPLSNDSPARDCLPVPSDHDTSVQQLLQQPLGSFLKSSAMMNNKSLYSTQPEPRAMYPSAKAQKPRANQITFSNGANRDMDSTTTSSPYTYGGTATQLVSDSPIRHEHEQQYPPCLLLVPASFMEPDPPLRYSKASGKHNAKRRTKLNPNAPEFRPFANLNSKSGASDHVMKSTSKRNGADYPYLQASSPKTQENTKRFVVKTSGKNAADGTIFKVQNASCECYSCRMKLNRTCAMYAQQPVAVPSALTRNPEAPDSRYWTPTVAVPVTSKWTGASADAKKKRYPTGKYGRKAYQSKRAIRIKNVHNKECEPRKKVAKAAPSFDASNFPVLPKSNGPDMCEHKRSYYSSASTKKILSDVANDSSCTEASSTHEAGGVLETEIPDCRA